MNGNPKAEDNGICPHCGRADAVKLAPGPVELHNRDEHQKFRCDGCEAVWAGVRRQITDNRVKVAWRRYKW